MFQEIILKKKQSLLLGVKYVEVSCTSMESISY